jgi:hypothetical protein
VKTNSIKLKGRKVVILWQCTIPTIIPSLINDYVDIICGYGQAM